MLYLFVLSKALDFCDESKNTTNEKFQLGEYVMAIHITLYLQLD